MKNFTLKSLALAALAAFTVGCNEVEQVAPKSEVATQKGSGAVGGPVMMQAFYWDVPSGGNWWNTVKSKVSAWKTAGFSSMWLPPSAKAQNGALSMGYDPTDYFDLGNFNQNGSTETRFGSKAELDALITEAHKTGVTGHPFYMDVIADIVINHNSGGQSEANPYTGGNTWTKFNVASGKFNRTYNDFHPNNVKASDEGYFGGFPDVAHEKTYVQDWLWKRTDGVAKYYKNTVKFDGWRFDFVKGFGTWVVKDWVTYNPAFTVGELWDGNAQVLIDWANAANCSAFDFAAYYKMDEAFDGNDLTKLGGDMLLKRNSFKAVTFVANHDTDIIFNGKLLAYAYILTHEGYPCIFYRDYEEWLDKNKLNNLIWIHNNYATGGTTNRWIDNDEYIASRNGNGTNPGLIVYINNSTTWQEKWIDTQWTSTRIKDYTGASTWTPTTAADRRVKIQAPPKSYTVWSRF
ncbi:MAG: alpha-amylase [Flavobacterium sp.]|nr:MAG: alpha-amylase [Flavobacterium sp.]